MVCAIEYLGVVSSMSILSSIILRDVLRFIFLCSMLSTRFSICVKLLFINRVLRFLFNVMNFFA